MSKKDSKEQKTAASMQKLAEAIGELLHDEATPAFIHNELMDFTLDVCSRTRVSLTSQEIIGQALPLAFQRASAERKA